MATPTPLPDDSGTDLTLAEKYPVMVLGGITLLVTAAINVLVSLGVPISDDVAAAIGKLVDAAGGLVILLLLFRTMTSNAKVVSRTTNRGLVVAGDAAIEPTGTELPLAADALGLPVPLATVRPTRIADATPVIPYRPAHVEDVTPGWYCGNVGCDQLGPHEHPTGVAWSDETRNQEIPSD